MSASRVSGVLKKFTGFRPKSPSIPEKWKGGRLEKIGKILLVSYSCEIVTVTRSKCVIE
jgi:hypothetical protein